MEWADETIAQLQNLWAEGHSTAEIGRLMGVTKNAIVGKAHRLDLPARPSPIRRDPDAPRTQRTIPRATGQTLPALASLVDGSNGPSTFEPPPTTGGAGQRAPAATPLPAACRARPEIVRFVVPKITPPPTRPGHYGRVVTCCWPLGEPGTRDFRFCDCPSEPGRPYCEDHVKTAYVKVRDRREDAA